MLEMNCSCDKCQGSLREGRDKLFCEACYEELKDSYSQLEEQYDELEKKHDRLVLLNGDTQC